MGRRAGQCRCRRGRAAWRWPRWCPETSAGSGATRAAVAAAPVSAGTGTTTITRAATMGWAVVVPVAFLRRRRRRVGERRHSRGIDHDMAEGAGAGAFAAEFGLIA